MEEARPRYTAAKSVRASSSVIAPRVSGCAEVSSWMPIRWSVARRWALATAYGAGCGSGASAESGSGWAWSAGGDCGPVCDEGSEWC